MCVCMTYLLLVHIPPLSNQAKKQARSAPTVDEDGFVISKNGAKAAPINQKVPVAFPPLSVNTYSPVQEEENEESEEEAISEAEVSWSCSGILSLYRCI